MFKSYSEDLNRLNEPLPQLFVPPGQMPFVNLRFATSHTAPLSAAAVVPIDDIPRNSKWSREERVSRCRLASMYRLADLFQWSQGIYNHITVLFEYIYFYHKDSYRNDLNGLYIYYFINHRV